MSLAGLASPPGLTSAAGCDGGAVSLVLAFMRDDPAQLEIAPEGQKAADCQPGENVEVATSLLPTGDFNAEPFYLVLYG